MVLQTTSLEGRNFNIKNEKWQKKTSKHFKYVKKTKSHPAAYSQIFLYLTKQNPKTWWRL